MKTPMPSEVMSSTPDRSTSVGRRRAAAAHQAHVIALRLTPQEALHLPDDPFAGLGHAARAPRQLLAEAVEAVHLPPRVDRFREAVRADEPQLAGLDLDLKLRVVAPR